jgi:hypothetical protein
LVFGCYITGNGDIKNINQGKNMITTETKDLLKSGIELYEEGRYEIAYNEFTTLVNLEPDNAMALLGRGLSSVYIKDFIHDFMGDFRKAVTILPYLGELFEFHFDNQRNGEELLVIDILKKEFVESRCVAIIKHSVQS